MLQHPNFNPVALDLGFFQIHWYGISYLCAFLMGWWLANRRASKPNSGWVPDEIGDLIFYVVIGVIAGGKIGSALFYNTEFLLSNPLQALNPLNAGMSFHGGFLGVLVAFYVYARHTKRTFFQVADFVAPVTAIGMGFGRIGNFINGELWGRPTDLPWGMVFPNVDSQPRHPNQIYQFIGEGIILFAIVWWFSSSKRPLLSVPMIAVGVLLMVVGYKRNIID